MRLKKTAAVLTAVCVAFGAVGALAEEVVNYDDQIMLISEDAENYNGPIDFVETTEYAKRNVIGDFVSYADGQLTIKTETDYIINVSEETLVINADAEIISLEDVKEGAIISAVVSLMETRSIPAQTNGFVVIVAENEDQISKMPIYMETTDVVTTSIDDASFLSADGTYKVTLHSEIELVPFRTKNIVKAADIKNGAKLLVYSDIMTMSLPAQVNPYKVVVLSQGEEVHDDPTEEILVEPVEAEYDKRTVTGEFVEYLDGQISIKGETEFVINTNEDTIVIDENASVISFEDIKEGSFITATVSKMQTFSRIPQSYGYIVVVSSNADAKIPMYMEATDVTSTSIDEASFLSVDEEFEVSIGKETEVTPFRTKNILKAADIKDGAKLLVYSDIMTMSIPALVNPYKVVVLSSGEEVGNPYHMAVNGNNVLGEVIEKDGSKLLPIRVVCEAMGMNVDWHEETNSVTISNDKISVDLTLDINSYNGMELSAAPELINDKTYVPMNFFDEILNAHFSNCNFCIDINY